MPGIPQTLEVPPPVSVQTILYGIYQALGGSSGGGSGGSAITGEVKIWTTASAPTGYLLCDGTAVSRTTYANLFAVIGTTFGTGDDSTTFNVPDFRSRVPGGVNGVDFSSIGDMVGLSTNQIEANNLPPLNLSEVQVVSGIGSFVLNGVSYSGASGAISNIQPTLVVNFIIKT
jgi:microcystin-dependent protein